MKYQIAVQELNKIIGTLSNVIDDCTSTDKELLMDTVYVVEGLSDAMKSCSYDNSAKKVAVTTKAVNDYYQFIGRHVSMFELDWIESNVSRINNIFMDIKR